MPILDYFEDQSMAGQTELDETEMDDEERKGEDDADTEALGTVDQNADLVSEQQSEQSTSKASTATTKPSKMKSKKQKQAPYLYTVMFNKDESLLMAGGAGRNEFRIFDWKTEEVVAVINNLPKAIVSGAIADHSDRFAFGSMDSQIRLFDFMSMEELQRYVD